MDVYFKKEITYCFAGEKFKFDVGNTLFSTFDLDHGTDILLRAIDFENPKTILDLGCGYGPLGIILAKKYPQAEVTMVDRDLLAVKYARNNIKKNNITNATVLGSIGLEKVNDEKFDLIVSNIPAKIGDIAIAEEFILNPFKHLTPNGEFWFVVVNALNRLIPSVGRKNELNIKEIRKRNGHTVYRMKK
ncbi:MAG: methyltransferase [Candidatus Daviesbacteria bacterium]|nr:methyltransferase [Candidatus Daviesbacteria bacterium]